MGTVQCMDDKPLWNTRGCDAARGAYADRNDFF